MSHTHVIVMTTARTIPEKIEEVQKALHTVAEAARKQPGCVAYRILLSEDPTVTVNFEQWLSAEERDAFNAGPDVEKFIAAVSGAFVESPQPISYQEIA